jgi:hypothetical protein
VKLVIKKVKFDMNGPIGVIKKVKFNIIGSKSKIEKVKFIRGVVDG